MGSIGLHRQKCRGTLNSIRGSNHRLDTVSCLLSYNQGRVPDQPQRWVTHVLRTSDSRIDNRLNLRNKLDSLGIDDFLERTDDHLPYPLRRTRPTTLVVAVTFGVVDTCSISTGDGWTEGTNRFELRSVTGSRILSKVQELGCV
jgi:hypothetical protein